MIANGRRGRGDEILNLCFHGIGTPKRALEPDEELYWVRPSNSRSSWKSSASIRRFALHSTTVTRLM